jgi:hypothetical protein
VTLDPSRIEPGKPVELMLKAAGTDGLYLRSQHSGQGAALQLTYADHALADVSAGMPTGMSTETLTPGWDAKDHPLQTGKVTWSARAGSSGRLAFSATYVLKGAKPNHRYVAGVHFFEPLGSKVEAVSEFGGWRLPGNPEVLSREGVSAMVTSAWDFGVLQTDTQGNASASFSFDVPAREYHLQFSVRRGECKPAEGRTHGCAAVFRSGGRFGQDLVVFGAGATTNDIKATDQVEHPPVAGEWVVEGGYCPGSPMYIKQGASGEVESIHADLACLNGEKGAWDGRNIRWTGPSTLTFDYVIGPDSAPNLKGGTVRIEYKADGTATQHWHALTGQSGSENLRRGKPVDASRSGHPSVAGEWIVEGGYCPGSPMQVVQLASGEVKSVSSDITCRNGEKGGWDGRNIRWTGPSTLTFDYVMRPDSAPNLKGGTVRIEYKSDGSATWHWHALTGQTGSENLRRGKPTDASAGLHPRVGGVWVQKGGYCDGARQTITQDPSGKVTSIVTVFDKCRGGETGVWDASNIRWESRNVLLYDYSFRPGGPAHFEPGHHRLEFVDAANANLAFKTANHSGNERLVRNGGGGGRVAD